MTSSSSMKPVSRGWRPYSSATWLAKSSWSETTSRSAPSSSASIVRTWRPCDRNISGTYPHSDAYGVENSFFDQAAIRYPGRIRLREHFRCMPEIIQFSNNLCYASEPLIPLRQYGTGRLDPVVTTRYVETGYQEGRSPRIANPPEADAIVEQILASCENEAYDDKSMGVISLLGRDQAELIREKLLDSLGAEKIDKRQLVCGDAYAFQGDERDVIFMSLVSAPGEGHRIGTLSTEAAKRRFNVAASRARDQMWLFHSATLNDLSPRDSPLQPARILPQTDCAATDRLGSRRRHARARGRPETLGRSCASAIRQLVRGRRLSRNCPQRIQSSPAI